MTRALITGAAGQDGWYLAELLAARGDEVHGVVRPASAPSVHDAVVRHDADLSIPGSITAVVSRVDPDVVFNLAAVSSVPESWTNPILTERMNAGVVVELLAVIRDRLESTGRSTRVIHASSAEMFGNPERSPQDESTPIRPTSPYGAAKAYAHHLVGLYRAAGVEVSSCILFNHESPRRPERFVSRKIALGVARIRAGMQETIELGNLDAKRDWGWAPDFADALARVASSETLDDYVVATGVSHSVYDFARSAFIHAGISDWEDRVVSSRDLARPQDAVEQIGDASKIGAALGWRPTVDFADLVARMVDTDIARLSHPADQIA